MLLMSENFTQTFRQLLKTLQIFKKDLMFLGLFIPWKLDKNIPNTAQNIANVFKYFKNKCFSKKI